MGTVIKTAKGRGPLARFLTQAGVGTAFTYLTSGVFLSGLALYMGAGDVAVSYLSVIVNICGVLILGFSAFLERFRSRKRLAVWLTALSRGTTLFLVAIPALAPTGLRLPLFLTAVVVAFTLQAQTTVVLNQWMLGFLGEQGRGRYISARQTLTLVVTVALSLAGGYWMDANGGSYTGFVLLFASAGVMGGLEVLLLSRTPDGPDYRPEGPRAGLGAMMAAPLRDRRFLGFVVYVVLFYLLLNVSDSFTMVYMMKYLALPYRAITALSLLLSLPQIVLLGLWGRLGDKKGAKFALRASIWLFAGETFFLFFASPERWFVFIPLAFLTASAGNAGFVVSVFNRRYELMPEENRIVYDNFFSAAVGAGFILGPMLGGAIKGWLESGGLAELVPHGGIRLLYLVSTVGILLLQAIGRNVWDGETACQGCHAPQ